MGAARLVSTHRRLADGRRPVGVRPTPDPQRPARIPAWGRLLRGLAGVLAGGLVVLSLGLLVVWLLADGWGVPGPGGGTVVGHLVGAVVAVAGQRVTDRDPGRVGTLAAVVVVATAALVLGLGWFL